MFSSNPNYTQGYKIKYFHMSRESEVKLAKVSASVCDVS